MGGGNSFFSPSKLLVMGLPIVWLLGWILQLVALLGPSNGVFINVYLFGIKSASLFSDPWPGYGGLNYVGASQLNYGYNASADQIARFVTTTYTTTYGIETGTQTIVTTAAVTTVATSYAPGATGAGAGSGSGSDSGSGSGSGTGTGSSGTGTGSSGAGSSGGSGSGSTGSGSGSGGSADPNQNTSQNDPNIDDNGPVALYVGPYSYAYRLQPDGELVKIHGGLVSLDSVSPTSPLTYAAWAWSSKEVQSLLTFRLSVIPILCSVSIAFGILATGLLFYGLLLSMQTGFDPDSSDGYKMVKPALWIGSIAILLLLILIYYSSFVLGEQCQSLNIAFLNAGIAYRCYQGDAPIFWRITFIIYICVSIIYITQLVNFNPTKAKPKSEEEKKADAKKKAEEAAIKEQDEFNEVWRRFIRWGAVRVPLAFLGISEPGPTVERKK